MLTGIVVLGLASAGGLAVALFALAVLLDFRGCTTSIVDHGRRQVGWARGRLFRGEYSPALVRAFALQLMAVALMGPFALFGIAGMPVNVVLPVVLYMGAFMAVLVMGGAVQMRSGFRRMIAPIFGLLLFALFGAMFLMIMLVAWAAQSII